MLKIALFLGAAIILWRLAFGTWPWDMASTKRKPPSARVETVKQARRILGVGADASHAEIAKAHRALVSRVHPDKGGDPIAAARANAARDLLIGRPAIKEDKPDA